MVRYHVEYRINKKGAEYFRTRDAQAAKEKYAELCIKRPGVFSMQSRRVPLDRHGVELTDLNGHTLWSAWS